MLILKCRSTSPPCRVCAGCSFCVVCSSLQATSIWLSPSPPCCVSASSQPSQPVYLPLQSHLSLSLFNLPSSTVYILSIRFTNYFLFPSWGHDLDWYLKHICVQCVFIGGTCGFSCMVSIDGALRLLILLSWIKCLQFCPLERLRCI